MRTLANIQTISALERIEGADAIKKVRVRGSWLVIKRGQHWPRDRVAYCEIDSLLPERPEFEFLRKSCYRPAILGPTGQVLLLAGFRIKTAKLRGQASQGICFPLSILPEGEGASTADGADVTALLGIFKYEPPLPTSARGSHGASLLIAPAAAAADKSPGRSNQHFLMIGHSAAVHRW